MARPPEIKRYILERRDQLIFGEHRAGWSSADIGRMFGLSRSRVMRILERLEREAMSGKKAE